MMNAFNGELTVMDHHQWYYENVEGEREDYNEAVGNGRFIQYTWDEYYDSINKAWYPFVLDWSKNKYKMEC